MPDETWRERLLERAKARYIGAASDYVHILYGHKVYLERNRYYTQAKKFEYEHSELKKILEKFNACITET